MKQIKKIIKKINKKNFEKLKYINYYLKYSIDDKIILLESQQGREINGNIYYILKELTENKSYNSYKLFLTVLKENKAKIKKFLDDKGIQNVNFIEINTKEYFKIIAKAKYLINDNTFLPFFIKKKGQVYLNTWHGTPLKSLGKNIKNDMHNIGNTQKNFLMSDYLLYPNRYTKEHMVEDYMIKNLGCDINIIMNGYPRNSVFFDENQRNIVRKEMGLENKQVIAYMPTWRGTVQKQINKDQKITKILNELEKKLKPNQVLYVNLHPIEKATVNYDNYKNIKPFPSNYETYEFLNIADILITDYSSVFFDFANLKRPMIFYMYDYESYKNNLRDFYIDLEELPGPIMKESNEIELCKMIKNINQEQKKYKVKYEKFHKKYNYLDSKDCSRKVLEECVFDAEDKTDR